MRHGRQAADGELLGAIEEVAAADVAVLVLVKQIQQLLRVIGRFLSFHGLTPLPFRPHCRSANANSALPAATVTYCFPLTE